MTTRADGANWVDKLAEVAERIAPRFVRAEPRRRGAADLRGLLAPVERQNGWHLAEAAGNRTPDAVQDFLSRMRGDADAIAVLDETSFLKKGSKSYRPAEALTRM